MDDAIERLIEIFHLQPLPEEGGLFIQTYQSQDMIPFEGLPERYSGPRHMGTAILFLLTHEPDSFSAMHRLQTDEMYHFYLGDPVDMLMLFPDGTSQAVTLGPEVFSGQRVQHLVPAGVWQGARLAAGGHYALLGTTMAPGFDPTDFQLGLRSELQTGWPDASAAISSLARK